MELETIVSISQATLKLLSSLNIDLFRDQLQYRLLVLPPEEGSFRWRYVICAAGVALWTFVESDVGKGFIKGLTDHEPQYWAERVGKIFGGRANPYELEGSADSETDSSAEVNKFDELVSSYILCQVLISFLSKEQSEIAKTIPSNYLSTSYSARNEFYEACLSDPRIKGVGYSDDHEFPISRKEFLDFIVPISERDEIFNSGLWNSSIEDLSVTSPNWSRSDRTRTWKGRDSQGRERTFRVDDDAFWNKVKDRQIEAGIIDNVTVQWVHQLLKGKFRNHTVLRVLKYNGKTVSDPLTESDIQKICESLPTRNVAPDQLSFDI